jgi:glutamate transport system substrate-binding protein
MKRRTAIVSSVVTATAAAVLLAGCGSAPAAQQQQKAGQSAAQLTAQINQQAAVDMGPVGKNLPASPTLDRIRQRGHLVYAGAHSGIGFSQLNPTDNKLYGFDAGMAQLLAKYLLGKPDAQISAATSDSREALLANHTDDVAVETYTITPARAKLVNFAGPYYMAASGILVKSDNSSITKVSDLAGKNVATEAGAAADALKAAVPTAKPVLFQTTAECATAVAQGRVDASTLNNASLLGIVATNTQVKLLPDTFSSNPFGIGLPKDDPAFKTIVNQFLTEIYTDGTWAKLYTDTVGKLTKTPPPTPPKLGSVDGS